MKEQKKKILAAGAVFLVIVVLIVLYSSPEGFLARKRTAKNPNVPSYCLEAPKLKYPHGRSPDFDMNKLPATDMNVKLVSVSEKPGVREDLGLTEQRSFRILLERPGLNEKQEECMSGNGDIYTSDLLASLEPARMYYSDVSDTARDEGNSCNTSSFPHECVMNMTAVDGPVDRIIKVAFEDGTYAERKITIPFPGKMANPVITEPKNAPKNNANFGLHFKDTGADSYEVHLALCVPYGNKGINPCLHDWRIYLERTLGDVLNAHAEPEISGLAAKTENGTIILGSRMPLSYEPSEEKITYSVIAVRYGETPDGVKTSVETNYGVNFAIK